MHELSQPGFHPPLCGADRRVVTVSSCIHFPLLISRISTPFNYWRVREINRPSKAGKENEQLPVVSFFFLIVWATHYKFLLIIIYKICVAHSIKKKETGSCYRWSFLSYFLFTQITGN